MQRVKITFFCFLMLGMAHGVLAQCGLQSGPMTGYSTMKEVAIWAQTKCAQEVTIEYWITGEAGKKWKTDPVQTSKEAAFTAHLIADQVQPGHYYEYQIIIDGAVVSRPYQLKFKTPSLWQWRGDPPAFSFIAGSCVYVNEPEVDRPGRPYGGENEIFNQMASEDADMMIWLGDNIYLREVDWNSMTGIQHRYTHGRSIPELQPLLAGMHHYAIWDDHDYGPNDSDRSYWGKDMTLKAFKQFWANPNYHVGNSESITGTYFWEDCQFFLLDNRWYRSPQNEHGQILGKTQIDWLIEALRYSKASFKFICVGGQFVSDLAVFENFAVYADERQAIIDSIDKYKIKNIVFLDGDRHHSDVSAMTTKNGIRIYDITSSPMTSSSYDHSAEKNTHLVPGSMVGERNYALISVSGKLKERVIDLKFKSKKGDVFFAHKIKQR